MAGGDFIVIAIVSLMSDSDYSQYFWGYGGEKLLFRGRYS